MGSSGKNIVAPSSFVAAAFAVLLVVASAAGCTEVADRQDGGKIVVAVTIPPEQEFVERVGETTSRLSCWCRRGPIRTPTNYPQESSPMSRRRRSML